MGLEDFMYRLKNKYKKRSLSELLAKYREKGTVRQVEVVKSEIEYFAIDSRNEVAFSGDIETIRAQLNMVLQIDDIKDCITGSALEKDSKTAFLMLMDEYHKQLERKVRDIKWLKLNEEELSDTISEIVFKVMEKNIFNNLMIALYRGLCFAKSEANFSVISCINNYLSRCGIYTKMVRRGEIVNRKNQGYLTINPQFELTNDADKNNMIAEVEKLPYFMDFYDEDGELDTHQSNGKVVIFKKG